MFHILVFFSHSRHVKRHMIHSIHGVYILLFYEPVLQFTFYLFIFISSLCLVRLWGSNFYLSTKNFYTVLPYFYAKMIALVYFASYFLFISKLCILLFACFLFKKCILIKLTLLFNPIKSLCLFIFKFSLFIFAINPSY